MERSELVSLPFPYGYWSVNILDHPIALASVVAAVAFMLIYAFLAPSIKPRLGPQRINPRGAKKITPRELPQRRW